MHASSYEQHQELLNQNSNWRGGGVTYQGANAQSFNSNDGLSRDIKIWLQELQELGFQQQNTSFWSERERERGRRHT